MTQGFEVDTEHVALLEVVLTELDVLFSIVEVGVWDGWSISETFAHHPTHILHIINYFEFDYLIQEVAHWELCQALVFLDLRPIDHSIELFSHFGYRLARLGQV